MVSALIIGSVLLAANPPASAAELSEPDRQLYRQAKADARRDPDAHVRLALWCESHGLEAERLKHLAIAVLTDPKHATARGLLGLVAYRGQWQKPDQVAAKVRSDAELAATLAEYNAKRDKLPNTADAHWKLALWCEEHGLKAEAAAHLTAVVRLDPSREGAWKRLGCKKHNGRWMTNAQVAAEEAEAEEQAKADRHWRPLLEKWRAWLRQKDKRAEAERRLNGLADPRAVPSVWMVFASGREDYQALAVRLLGQIDAPGASRALAVLAVFGKSAEVRRIATETLTRRDPRDFMPLLIGLLHDPIKYEVRPVGGPGSPGALFVEGKRFNVQRLYAAPPAFNLNRSPIGYQGWAGPFEGWAGYDDRGQPVVVRRVEGGADLVFAWSLSDTTRQIMSAPDPLQLRTLQGIVANPQGAQQIVANYQAQSRPQAQGVVQSTGMVGMAPIDIERAYIESRTAAIIAESWKVAGVAQQQLQSDIKAIESYNANAREVNERTAQILDNVTGQDFGQDREAWRAWWINQLGYAYTPPSSIAKPTLVQNVPLAYLPTVPKDFTWSPQTGFLAISCFGAGTPVLTLSGRRPIEGLRIGDQVLARNAKTGALSFQPIVDIHHNPPGETFRISLGGETVISSHFHRFWKAGKGWVMARDLKVGDTIRTLEGLATIASVEPAQRQPLFNLDVAEDRSFFVGQSGILVHDNTLPAPALNPFDAEPELVAAKAGAGE